MPDVKITKETWMDLVDVVRTTKNKDAPIWSCLFGYYSVCINSIISPLSTGLWNLYHSIGGTKNETLASYWELPAIYGDACTLINEEVKKLDKQRAKAEQAKTNAQERRISMQGRR